MACSLKTQKFLLQTPIGNLELAVCVKGLHYVGEIEKSDDTFHPDISKSVTLKRDGKIEDDVEKHAVKTENWFREYFKDPESAKRNVVPTFCLDSVKGKSFLQIWMELANNVHSGQTIYYSDLGVLAGHSKGAAQLVGQAMAQNPFQIIVPCHRVVPKGGNVGQYSRGKKNKVKEWLLQFEGCKIDGLKKTKRT